MDMADLPAVRATIEDHRRTMKANEEARLRNKHPGARITFSDDPGGGFTVRSTSPYGDEKIVIGPGEPPEALIRVRECLREIHGLDE